MNHKINPTMDTSQGIKIVIRNYVNNTNNMAKGISIRVSVVAELRKSRYVSKSLIIDANSLLASALLY